MNPGDPSSLAGSLAGMMADEELRKDMGKRAKTSSLRYDWDRSAKKMEEIYLEASGKRMARS